MKVIAYELEPHELRDVSEETLARLGNLSFIMSTLYPEANTLELTYARGAGELDMLGVPPGLRTIIPQPVLYVSERYASPQGGAMYIVKTAAVMTGIVEGHAGSYPYGITLAHSYTPKIDAEGTGTGVEIIDAAIYQANGMSREGDHTWYTFDDEDIPGEIVVSAMADILRPVIVDGQSPGVILARSGTAADW